MHASTIIEYSSALSSTGRRMEVFLMLVVKNFILIHSSFYEEK